MQLKDTEDIPKTAYRDSFRMNQANIQKTYLEVKFMYILFSNCEVHGVPPIEAPGYLHLLGSPRSARIGKNLSFGWSSTPLPREGWAPRTDVSA